MIITTQANPRFYTTYNLSIPVVINDIIVIMTNTAGIIANYLQATQTIKFSII